MATATQTILPEQVLIATLHKAGGSVRIRDDVELARILNNAATSDPDGPFGPFKWHPLYHHSRLLGDTLQILDHAGSIVRENASQSYFKVSDHTLGPFGDAAYHRLSPKDRERLDEVANEIQRVFGPT